MIAPLRPGPSGRRGLALRLGVVALVAAFSRPALAQTSPAGPATDPAIAPSVERSAAPAPAPERSERAAKADAAGPESLIEDDDARQADARTADKLSRRVDVKLNNTSLRDALKYLSDRAEVDVFPDWKALERAGVTPDTPVELELGQSVPAEQALRWVLRSAGGDSVGYALDHGVVVVADRARLDRMTVTRAYDVSDLGDAGQGLPALIREVVAPSSWAEAGGAVGSIRPFGTKLLVTQTEPNHRQVERLLALLRAPPGEAGPVGSPAPPDRRAARDPAAVRRSMGNVKQLVDAVHQFVDDHGFLPREFPDDVRRYLGPDPAAVLTNPRQDKGKPGYVYVRPADRLGDIARPADTIMVYENLAEWGDGIAVGYADGHVEFARDRADFVKRLNLTPRADRPDHPDDARAEPRTP